ncbi:MAG: queuosine precursor transporter [Methanosphaera sp.]|uniref:queuosine precursor transporter n=1 Tax=Methanosphaera sp. TaxID=2666342 RepID=UPI0025DFD468|nr:queuosine precursor transporter [Methanosphaera sp.]MCI5866590.1 queuosine precursor transporter [Methanosphaera sp.]MDD6535069.1 queuosine precursor transporter [Methanosphaera sp.]MDY3955501.1 queuosine precursor transporter [Methanosphaera sp.]
MEITDDDKKVVIIVIFCMSLCISNILTVKFIDLGYYNLFIPAGILMYPLVYLLSNIITQVYGEHAAKRVIIMGLFANIIFVLLTLTMLFLPTAGSNIHDPQLAFIFGKTPRLFIAGRIAYLAGSFANASLTTVMHTKFSKIRPRYRSIFTISIGLFIDILIFISLGYIGEVSLVAIISMIITYWIFNVIVICIINPLIKPTIRWIN